MDRILTDPGVPSPKVFHPKSIILDPSSAAVPVVVALPAAEVAVEVLAVEVVEEVEAAVGSRVSKKLLTCQN